jgi:hypothetical protein
VEAYRFRSLSVGLVNDLAHVWHAGKPSLSGAFLRASFLLADTRFPSFKQGPQ